MLRHAADICRHMHISSISIQQQLETMSCNNWSLFCKSISITTARKWWSWL